MTNLIPLVLLWLWNNNNSKAQAAPLTRSAAPPWPTPNSPPPMPAFNARPTPSKAPSADPSRSSTPLAQLHNAPPKVKPASTPDQIKQTAIQAFKKKATQQLKARVSPTNLVRSATKGVSPSSLLSSALTFNSNTSTSVPVSDVQTIVVRNGAKIKKDGLYGPKTAAAWTKLAKAKGLPATISRVGPKTAKVVTRTFDSLSTPAVP